MSNMHTAQDSPQCQNGICEFNRLEEARFWARIMQEHALFIALGLPADQLAFREEAEDFIKIFKNLRDRLEKVSVLEGDLLRDMTKAVREIIEFKAKLLRLLLQCNAAPGGNYPLLLDHIRREAMHFLDLLKIFSRLLETARDLESMDETKPMNFNTVVRFTETAIKNTIELRDFKATAFELAKLCELLSIVSTPLLLDHVRREADKFLDEMEVLLPEVRRCHSTLK